MRLIRLILFIFTCSGVFGQASLEPPDFDVTEALYRKGVDVAALPGLASLTRRASQSGCSIACNALQILFGDELVTQSNTILYDNFTASYWSAQQASLDPECIFKPSTPKQLSIQILISRLTQCPFTAKSGGHAAFAGGSSIQGGITVSLEKFKIIAVADDKNTVSLTPGNTWYDVYSATESQDVVVIGGRVSAIGVGGLTLGGGISFFSGLHGWACDNIADYELVTANGEILQVSPTTYSDLYWALRGGGNNFGIVTRFTAYAYPLKGQLMWGGGRLSTENEFPALIQAFYNLGTSGATSDPNAAQFMSFFSANGTQLAQTELTYAQPVSNASVFAEYLKIPALADTTGIRTLRNITAELALVNPDGKRETYWVAAYKVTPEMVTTCKDIFFSEIASVADARGIIPAVTLQVITVPILEHMQVRGGNALGLTPDDGPVLIANVAIMWDDIADDKRILQASHNFVSRSTEFAKQHGWANEYIYMNYASQFQDVIAGYGEQNQARLQKIAKKYDPKGVFQTLMPGYFKLTGPPATWPG